MVPTTSPTTASTTMVPTTSPTTASTTMVPTTAPTTASTTTPAVTLINPCTSGIYWNATATRVAGTGSSGTAANQLSSPTGLFIDSSNNLYISDGGNYRIMGYVPGNTTGTMLVGAGGTGTGLNQLSTGVRYNYVDSNQNIYISDAYNNRVIRWASNAPAGVIVAGNGTFGTTLNQLYYPYGVWVDSNSNVFVAEYQSHRVTQWMAGATAGTVVAGITSSSGSTVNKLSSPAGLYYDEGNQDLYISNSGSAATVMKWHVGASSGTVLAGLPGTAGSNSSQLSAPMGLTLDQWFNLYVADRTNNRVQFFCNGSTTGRTIAGSGAGGSTISAPYDVKLDSQLNLYVTENSGAKVTKFSKL